MATVERVLILHGGDRPAADEIGRIIYRLEQATGTDLIGVRITPFGPGFGQPDESIAQALVVRLEYEGDLSGGALERTTVQTFSLDGARRVVAAVVMAEERNPWVKDLIAKHLEKIDLLGNAVAWQPGWAMLSSEPAVSFVACAAE
ncbi:hypothetical protein EDC02_7124 [Micromonospora sp. Llam0]|uniref:hypothetical protein n=1 Tax=Micromonospora sp. Llam0 TaxID=2485143 RepID=UPI000F4A70A3|nr:hypothetical protein [Micromonospora sp. Llam0]ROO52213.1 hypothetical protein EDC02_7124 [Micromonospora sp. Llam0]